MHKNKASIIRPQSPYGATLELLTGKCNLRCIYCVIQTDKYDFPDYPRLQMAPEIIEHVKLLFSRDRPTSINLCGNGETTMLEDWTTICEPFLSLADKVDTISNLAKTLSREELSFLARLGGITTSIDTADAKLLMEIRKPVQLRNIVLNLNLVRAEAALQGHPPPSFNINCTVTTKNYRELTRLIALASSLGIGHVTFSDVFETVTAITHGVRSISTISPDALTGAKTEFQQASALAAKVGITIGISSHQLSTLFTDGGTTTMKGGLASRDQTTVLCLQPWRKLFVNADGHASFCCRHMGSTECDITSFSSVRDILNNANAVQLRDALLSGHCPERCRSCEHGQPATPDQLKKTIQMFQMNQTKFAAIVRRLPLMQTIWRVLRKFMHPIR